MSHLRRLRRRDAPDDGAFDEPLRDDLLPDGITVDRVDADGLWLKDRHARNRRLHARIDRAELRERLEEADDHGLLPWCLRCGGSALAPFSTLRQEHPAVWAALSEAV